jgi:hypothetical protein
MGTSQAMNLYMRKHHINAQTTIRRTGTYQNTFSSRDRLLNKLEQWMRKFQNTGMCGIHIEWPMTDWEFVVM